MTNEELIIHNSKKKLEKHFKAYVQRKRLEKLKVQMSIKI